MSTVDKTQPSAENLKNRLEFEELISDLSSRFINLKPDEVNLEIETTLRRVCESLGIDLAVLWQWSSLAPGAVIMPTHAYAGEGLQAPGPMSQEQFPWYAGEMRAGRIVAVPSLAALPAEAAVDRETCRLLGVKSTLCFPLALGGEPPIGALGLNSVHAERNWPDALVQRLRLVAQIFTNALARARHEQRLQASARRLAAGAEIAGLAFYEVDFGNAAIYFEDRFRDLFGIPADRDHGLQALEFWIEHLHPDDRPSILHRREQLHAGKLEQLSAEYRFLHPTRGERWMHHLARVARRDAAGRTVQSFGAVRDITESKRAENALRDLSQRLIQAHEEERALLARELHDDVTQRLAVLAIDVGRAELVARDPSQAAAMGSIRAGLARLSEDIHSLAYQLHPSVLEELGLVEALRAEGERRVRQGRLDLSMDLDPLSAAIGKGAALCLFRVAQEAMNNVARHAGTRAARVTLRQMGGGLLLAVRDDGVGFDPASPGKSRSLGLASMRERVRLVDGTLDIETAPGRGTAIIAWVPAEGEAP
jgi:PAS domain S-box-containing protein